MDEKETKVCIKLIDSYLCPGDGEQAHITNNSQVCPCGNTNLVSLSRILDRESTTASYLQILQEEYPGIEEQHIGRVYRS